MRMGVVVMACGLCAATLPGCVHVDPGGTVLNVRSKDKEEAKVVRSQLWRVERAVEEVREAYGMDDLVIEVIVADIGGLGQTLPGIDDRLHVDAAIVTINTKLFVENHPDLDAILLGLLAHEMAHGVHYARMSTADAAELGLRYKKYMESPDGDLKDWIRAYEQLTDLTTIAHGYGEPLQHQKRASQDNLARHHPPKVWNFYLTEDEIVVFMDDREQLIIVAEQHLDTLNLPSLRRLTEEPPFPDETVIDTQPQ